MTPQRNTEVVAKIELCLISAEFSHDLHEFCFGVGPRSETYTIPKIVIVLSFQMLILVQK